MSYTYTAKSLGFGQLPSSKGDLLAPSGVSYIVHNVILHNTNTTTENSVLYYNSGSEYLLYNLSLLANETIHLKYSQNGLVITNGAKITGNTTTASKVTYKFNGSEVGTTIATYFYTPKSLAFGQLSNTKGNVYVPSGVTGLVKSITLHNINTIDETVDLYFHDGSNEYKTYSFTLASNASIILSYPGEGDVVTNGAKITGNSTVSAKVTYKIDGLERS